jgi:hypothetical protein
VEDDVTAYADYKAGPDAPYISEKGATGVFITSTGDTPGDNRLEILLDGGKLIAESDKLMRWDLKTWEPEFTATYTGGFGEPEYNVYEVETDGENPQHKGVLIKFAAHILRGEPLVAPGIEGIRGLMISNAMHLSSWLGKPVTLPVDEDLYYEELMKRAATSRHKEDAGVVLSTDGSYNAGVK